MRSGQVGQPDFAAPAHPEFRAAGQQAHLGAHRHGLATWLVQHHQRLACAAHRKHHDGATAGVGRDLLHHIAHFHFHVHVQRKIHQVNLDLVGLPGQQARHEGQSA